MSESQSLRRQQVARAAAAAASSKMPSARASDPISSPASSHLSGHKPRKRDTQADGDSRMRSANNRSSCSNARVPSTGMQTRAKGLSDKNSTQMCANTFSVYETPQHLCRNWSRTKSSSFGLSANGLSASSATSSSKRALTEVASKRLSESTMRKATSGRPSNKSERPCGAICNPRTTRAGTAPPPQAAPKQPNISRNRSFGAASARCTKSTTVPWPSV
mmetsp:Transcript_18330/g.50273  ORF Transcript_18330/g.50273 Transcript_18330/m.50273 type:complete len:219 (+) Transcript_18330:1155-1811(+)